MAGTAVAAPFAYITKADSTVSVIDVATNTVVATVTVGGGNLEGVAVNPAGTRVYVVNQNTGTTSVIDTACNTVVATVAAGASPFNGGIAVTPDGTRVYQAARVNIGGGAVEEARHGNRYRDQHRGR